MNGLIEKLEYRPSIDGLRAIAIIPVVLFHAGLGCPGGYIGVDVFFVISGFLITSLIWKDLESGKFTFALFWERRARRIAPALIVMTLCVLGAGLYFLLPGDLEDLGLAAASQALFAANFYYWRNSGYFTGAGEEKALLHTWSLAVEEQYYLIVPLVCSLLFQFSIFRRRLIIIATFCVVIALSFLLSLYLVAYHPVNAFYLLPSRTWELLLGSLVAFIPCPPRVAGRRWLREGSAFAGIVAIILPIFLYTKQMAFPGLAALPVCAGTALVIWTTTGDTHARPTAIARLLAMKPCVFIGLTSYSIYLWHWPPLAFANYFTIKAMTQGQRVAILIPSLIAALLSYYFVETPFRKRAWGQSRGTMLSLAASGLCITLAAGVLFLIQQGFPRRFSENALRLAEAKSQIRRFKEAEIDDLKNNNLVDMGDTSGDEKPRVFLWGDSHTKSSYPAFDLYLKQQHIAGKVVSRAGTAPVIHWRSPRAHTDYFDTEAYNAAALEYIESHRFEDVILVAYWGRYQNIDGSFPKSFLSALLDTVERLRSSGARVWMMLNVPIHPFDVAKVLARHSDDVESIALQAAEPTERSKSDGFDPAFLNQLRERGVNIIDPKPSFLNTRTGRFDIVQDYKSYYIDDNHLSYNGSEIVLMPFLKQSLLLSTPPQHSSDSE